MVDKFKLEKLNTLPTTYTPNTLYVIPIQGSPTEVELYFSNLDGSGVKKSRIGALSYNDLKDRPVASITDLVSNRVCITDTQNKVITSSITAVELNTLSNISSNIQTQLNDKQRSITGAVSNITNTDLSPNTVVITDASGKIVASNDISNTELQTLNGIVTGLSDGQPITIQYQLNGKQATITGAASTLTDVNLTPNYTLVSNANGKVSISSISTNMLNTLSNIDTQKTIQDQLNTKQPIVSGAGSTILDVNLTSEMVLSSSVFGKVIASTISVNKLNTLNDITTTETIQSQLNNKQAKIVGAASTITNNNLDTNVVVVTDSSGKIGSLSNISVDELRTLDGIATGSVAGVPITVQSQLNGKASLDPLTNQLLNSQIPSSLAGGMIYKGSLSEASLPGATPSNKGHYYIINVDSANYASGDWAISNGASWDKIDNTDRVTAVGGFVGDVTKQRLGIDQVDNTRDASKIVASAGKLTTSRNISVAGDVSFTVSFDGSADVTVSSVIPSKITARTTAALYPFTVDEKGFITNTGNAVNLATVATSGSYADLSNKPTIPTLPTLATVATSGSYTDLSNKPTIPTLPTLATVATSGLYQDLTDANNIPIQKNALVKGKMCIIDTGTTASISYSTFSKIGDSLMIYNNTSSNITISPSSGSGQLPFRVDGSAANTQSFTIKPRTTAGLLVIGNVANSSNYWDILVTGKGVA